MSSFFDFSLSSRLFSPARFVIFCTGDPHANWAYFQEQKSAHINFNLRLSTGCMTDFHEPGTDTGSLIEAEFPKLGPSKIQKNARIGKASDFWNRYEQDIKLAADLGDSPRSAPAVTSPTCDMTCTVQPCPQLLRWYEAVHDRCFPLQGAILFASP